MITLQWACLTLMNVLRIWESCMKCAVSQVTLWRKINHKDHPWFWLPDDELKTASTDSGPVEGQESMQKVWSAIHLVTCIQSSKTRLDIHWTSDRLTVIGHEITPPYSPKPGGKIKHQMVARLWNGISMLQSHSRGKPDMHQKGGDVAPSGGTDGSSWIGQAFLNLLTLLSTYSYW